MKHQLRRDKVKEAKAGGEVFLMKKLRKPTKEDLEKQNEMLRKRNALLLRLLLEQTEKPTKKSKRKLERILAEKDDKSP